MKGENFTSCYHIEEKFYRITVHDSHHFSPPCELSSSCWSSITGSWIQQTLTSIRLQNTCKLEEGGGRDCNFTSLCRYISIQIILTCPSPAQWNAASVMKRTIRASPRSIPLALRFLQPMIFSHEITWNVYTNLMHKVAP